MAHNCIQGMARDYFAEWYAACLDAGIDVLFTVHDEIVALADEGDAEEAARTMEELAARPPAWCADMPVRAESKITKRYTK